MRKDFKVFTDGGDSVIDVKHKLRLAAGKNPSRHKAQREPETSIKKVLSDRGRKNSRTKGASAELDVAKKFSKWCGEVVRRTPMSGGWSNAKFGVTADLVCDHKRFPWSVEVKHREGWVLDDLVTGVRKEHDKSIVQWWAQCVKATPAKKEPLLVFRRNHLPWLVMCRSQWVQEHARPSVYGRPHMLIATMWRSVDGDFHDDEVEIYTLDAFLGMIMIPKGMKNWRPE